MTLVGRLEYLRPAAASDDPFLYALFATTWESEVAALPNQNLAQHVLRIQHIAQERRYAARYPDHERAVLLDDDGRPVGRLYVHDDGLTMRLVDLTLLPEVRSRGIGSGVIRDLQRVAAEIGRSLAVAVSRRNREAAELVSRLGFALVDVDDLDHFFVWTAEPPAEREPEGAARSAGTQVTGSRHHGR